MFLHLEKVGGVENMENQPPCSERKIKANSLDMIILPICRQVREFGSFVSKILFVCNNARQLVTHKMRVRYSVSDLAQTRSAVAVL
ncbi:hypothetical protein NTQ09_000187 [Escherichia coli]|nr:hypothetical protein [Escherichia coli]